VKIKFFKKFISTAIILSLTSGLMSNMSSFASGDIPTPVEPTNTDGNDNPSQNNNQNSSNSRSRASSNNNQNSSYNRSNVSADDNQNSSYNRSNVSSNDNQNSSSNRSNVSSNDNQNSSYNRSNVSSNDNQNSSSNRSNINSVDTTDNTLHAYLTNLIRQTMLNDPSKISALLAQIFADTAVPIEEKQRLLSEIIEGMIFNKDVSMENFQFLLHAILDLLKNPNISMELKQIILNMLNEFINQALQWLNEIKADAKANQDTAQMILQKIEIISNSIAQPTDDIIKNIDNQESEEIKHNNITLLSMAYNILTNVAIQLGNNGAEIQNTIVESLKKLKQSKNSELKKIGTDSLTQISSKSTNKDTKEKATNLLKAK